MIGELATDDHGLSAGPCVASMRDPERRLLPSGVVLFAFSRYSLIRPKLPSASDAGRLTDGAAGVLTKWRYRGCDRFRRHHSGDLVHGARLAPSPDGMRLERQVRISPLEGDGFEFSVPETAETVYLGGRAG